MKQARGKIENDTSAVKTRRDHEGDTDKAHPTQPHPIGHMTSGREAGGAGEGRRERRAALPSSPLLPRRNC